MLSGRSVYLRTFKGLQLPFMDEPLVNSWIVIMLAYTVRRLPYALRSCVAALQQLHVSLEEAAQSLGADRGRTIRRIVIPLMSGGIIAGLFPFQESAEPPVTPALNDLVGSRESTLCFHRRVTLKVEHGN